MGVRVAVLVSGAGTNLQALLDYPAVGPQIALVVSDRDGVRALQRASDASIETLVMLPSDHDGRDAYSEALRDALIDRDIEVVVNAGFMRILGPAFAEAFAGKWLNVHPALLPAFPGAHAVTDALEWGAKVTGVTVHLVDEQVDHGPIVLQEAVAVGAEDDGGSLASKIHEVEHRLLPLAARLLLEGRLKVDGRRVVVIEAPDA
jgi:phosphoribosylglycinamide formyltransferase-1